MQFLQPLFLIGLSAILIPIFIHLFNFRRYKTVYFSNVKLLQDILQKTKKESQILHLIVLLLRILGISCLVIAFAQPYILRTSQQKNSGNIVTLFVDNSFSMEAASSNGNFLYDATDAAKKIVNAFSFNDDFVLVTQDFAGKESHILNKDEVLTRLDEIEISPKSRSLNEIIAFKNNVASYSRKQNRIDYYISDFQKNRYDFSSFPYDTGAYVYLMPVGAKQQNNVAIDSCWFDTPVFREGYQVTLVVRVQNYGQSDVVKLPLRLYINNEQCALAALDIKAGTYTDCQLNYTINSAGIQLGTLEINDSPITFDDRLYFVYEVAAVTEIITIQEKNKNRYLNALYGKDSLFNYQVMDVRQINYSSFKECQLVILDQLVEITSGLTDELKKFVEAGGDLLVFPNENYQETAWQNFFSAMRLPAYQALSSQPMKVEKVNMESVYFNRAIERNDATWEMPTVLKHFPIPRTSSLFENIMLLENGDPLLAVYPIEKGKVFLSAVALDDVFGNTHKNAFFFIPLHNIAIMGQIQSKLYNTLGRDEMQVIAKKANHAEDLFILKSTVSGAEFVPEQRNTGGETYLYFHSQVQNAGFYDLNKGGARYGTIAFNYDRAESNLDYYTEQELENATKDSKAHVQVLSANTQNLTEKVAEKLHGTPLWRYFILLALACFLAEVIVLRFFGKVKLGRLKLIF